MRSQYQVGANVVWNERVKQGGSNLSAVALAEVDLSAVALAEVDLSAVALAEVEDPPLRSRTTGRGRPTAIREHAARGEQTSEWACHNDGRQVLH